MQSTVHNLKRSLRKSLKIAINKLTDNVKRNESNIITDKLLNLEIYKQSSRISVYLSMPSEVDTNEILKDIFQKDKKCYVPLYTNDDMKMVRLHGIEDYEALPLTSWNIKQPHENEERETAMDSGGLDLIILPGLGFSKGGQRLGRGRAYYDNYLAKHVNLLHKKPFTVGLAYSVQICPEIPCTETDVKLDMVLYP